MIEDILNAIVSWFIGLLRDTTWNIVEAFLANQMLRFPDWLTDQAAIINNRMTTLAIASYVVMLCVGGFVIMSNESIQSTYSAREIVPRLITGFALAALSWTVITNLQTINNEIVEAMVLGDNREEASDTITTFYAAFQLGDAVGSMIIIELIVTILHFIAIIMLFLTMLTRNVVWFMVASFAPIALACHALPFTEAAAFLWWRLIFACMASSIGQAAVIWTWQTLFQGISGDEVVASYTYKPFFVLALCWAIWKIHKSAFMWARGTPLRIPGGRLVKGLVKTAFIGAILRSNPLGMAVGAAAKRLPFLKGVASKLNPSKPRPRRRGPGTGPGRSEMPPARRNARPGPGKRPKSSTHGPKGRNDQKSDPKRRPSKTDPRKRGDRSKSPSKTPPVRKSKGSGGKAPRGNPRRGSTTKSSSGKSTPPHANPQRPAKPAKSGWTPAGGPASPPRPPRGAKRAPSGAHPAPEGSAPRRASKAKWRPDQAADTDTARPPGSRKRKWKPHPPPPSGGKWRKS